MIDETLIQEIKSDIEIHMDDLSYDSLMTAELHQKYLTRYYQEKKILRNVENEYNKKERKLKEYYSGKADLEVYKEKPFALKLTGAEVRQYVDEELAVEKEYMEDQKDLMKYLNSIVEGLLKRSFNISNIIKWEEHIHNAK